MWMKSRSSAPMPVGKLSVGAYQMVVPWALCIMHYGYQTCTRYVYIPCRFKKVIYWLNRFTQNGRAFEPKISAAAFLNSNYTSSFVAGLLLLRLHKKYSGKVGTFNEKN